MGKCVQLICGPAGSGKSTYVSALQEHCANSGRRIHVANLDPGADHFNYEVAFDIRDLVSVEDVMEELEYGPNGANIYCHEYLLENIEWLKEQMEQYDEDEYLVLDCAGQIELYTHLDIMRRFVNDLKMWGYQVVALFIVDATFVTDPAKFISGSLLSLSCMLQLELPHLNVLSKCDLVDEKELNAILDIQNASSGELLGGLGGGAGEEELQRAGRSEAGSTTL
jgi:GPN-loop GTPase